MAFDYGDIDTPDETVRSVAAEMSGGGLKPLTDEERADRERWREELRQRDEHDRVISERARAEAERWRLDAARREQEIAHREYVSRQREQFKQNNELADLKRHAERTEAYRNSVEQATVANLKTQYQNSLFSQLDQMIAQQYGPKVETEFDD
jgi:hypothetical protein